MSAGESKNHRGQDPCELAHIYDSAPTGLFLVSSDCKYLHVNHRYAALKGLQPDDYFGRQIGDVSPDFAAPVRRLVAQVAADLQPVEEDVTSSHKQSRAGETYRLRLFPVLNDDGSLHGVGGLVEDVSEERAREAMLKHVARELQHRVKNTLANVSALVEHAQRQTCDPAEALAILRRRINAMARTHSRLTEANWGPAPLYALLQQEILDLYGHDGISLEGPDIMLAAQPALAFSLGLHEMTANASLYGGLSRNEGQVHLSWSIEENKDSPSYVTFIWQESGGPSVEVPPPSGFGHRLIDVSFKTSLRGKLERIWTAEGLRYEIELPLGLLMGN